MKINDWEWNSLTPDEQTKLAGLLAFLPNDDIQIRKAKALLVEGYAPEVVAKLTGAPLKKVKQLHSESWNPVCRTQTKQTQRLIYRLSYEAWQAGDDLKTMCERWDYPLYSLVRLLKSRLTPEELNSRMPDQTDPLYIEYVKTCKFHATKKERLAKRAEKAREAKAEIYRKKLEREERVKQNRERKQAERDRKDAQRAAKVAADFH
ncbi:hypothetical protein WIA93_10395 [Citrobacter amalonaticus]|uniref:hypothetical protein n=1 Tax=Citrobacter amalonaticus TaxID=35703 RepID=UPI001157A11D|nr:hypothetical protein [Citrobacter amalonaticus]QDK86578.1 hypothetical protein FEO47_14300 [Citrobacter amalonaticus]